MIQVASVDLTLCKNDIYILASIVWLVFFITQIGPNLNGCKLCEAEEPNYVGPMLLPRQHQINRAGVRVRGVSD